MYWQPFFDFLIEFSGDKKLQEASAREQASVFSIKSNISVFFTMDYLGWNSIEQNTFIHKWVQYLA